MWLLNKQKVDWQADFEGLALHVGLLMRLARRRVTDAGAVEILRALPRSANLEVKADVSAYGRCAAAATQLSTANDRELLLKVLCYFREFAAMSAERREMMEACMIGTLTGLGMGS